MPASLPRLGGWRSVAALVVIAALVTGIGQTGAGHSVLEKAGLIQRPTPYTALSFSRPVNPVSVQAAGKRARFALTFRIQNAGTSTREYHWSVLLVQRPGHAHLIGSGSQAVGPGKTAPIPQVGKFTCGWGRAEFIVQLPAAPRAAEAIHAWTNCPRPQG
ncbi:MAG TPA: hypothetical protein VMH35_22940 [Streptosporangiaceae bacterium]|nr:hypothetical protein [Streptosporangiaceae bacterium]